VQDVSLSLKNPARDLRDQARLVGTMQQRDECGVGGNGVYWCRKIGRMSPVE
jgi:hypothetical protein